MSIFFRGTGLPTAVFKNQPLVPRSNLGGKVCARTDHWFRGQTLLVPGHGGGEGTLVQPACPVHPTSIQGPPGLNSNHPGTILECFPRPQFYCNVLHSWGWGIAIPPPQGSSAEDCTDVHG